MVEQKRPTTTRIPRTDGLQGAEVLKPQPADPETLTKGLQGAEKLKPQQPQPTTQPPKPAK